MLTYLHLQPYTHHQHAHHPIIIIMHIIPSSSSHMQRLMLLSLGGGRSRSIPPFTRQEVHFTPNHEATEQSLLSSSKLLGRESYLATDHTYQSTHRVEDHEASSPISPWAESHASPLFTHESSQGSGKTLCSDTNFVTTQFLGQ